MDRIILSMTSWKERLINKEITKCFNSLINQTVKAFSINLFLSEEEFPNHIDDLPSHIKPFLDKINVIFINDDLKSHNKWFWAFKMFKNDKIITVDDDIIYDENIVKELVETSNKFDNAIIAHRCHRFKLGYNKIQYKDFIKYETLKCSGILSEDDLFITTCGGVLFKPSLFGESIFNLNEIKGDFKLVDDIWLNMQIYMHKLKIICINSSKNNYVIPSLNKPNISLYYHNIYNNNNDKVLNLPRVKEIFENRLINEIINIVYITDKNYIDITKLSLNSLISTSNLSNKYKIYVMCFDNESMIEFAKFPSTKENIEIKPMMVDLNQVKIQELVLNHSKKHKTHVTAAAYIKFILPWLINENKIIYLDSDTIIHQDISIVFNENINDFYVGGVIDNLHNHCIAMTSLLLKHNNDTYEKVKNNKMYFNSGVMLMNLRKMRDEKIVEKLINCKLTIKTHFVDQDVFNIVIGDMAKSLPIEYNVPSFVSDRFENIVIEHVTFYTQKDSKFKYMQTKIKKGLT